MNILVILARFSPLLLSGTEKDLVNLLKDDNEIIKEGVLHVLAKAGGTIREQLAVSSSSVDLILERLCLEGSRRQAKYAVHALAAITKDDGLKSLSVLYKRLVDMLEEKTHLPAVLQSLGCIAQTAMPVFETRESEIEEFIRRKILECSNKAEDNANTCWDDRSELCSLKIFGIKTLVKSYLPVKDAHLRPGIDGLLGMLKNTLLYGEILKDIESSSVDKAHLRLASAKAVLRLSKYWDHKIPVDVFHLTLRTSEISYPQAKKLFLNKVHQYVKDRVLDAKYACAFLFNIIGSQLPEFEEDKHNLSDIIQMFHQAKARQLSVQCDANSQMPYPEFILPYLVHALAHHSCPNIDECKDVKAFELIYRQLHLFLSMLVHGDEDGKSEGSTNKEKERISAIYLIFQSIKRSDDIVDVAKSKNSHAICDLGLSITKRLAQKEDDLQESTLSVSLPSMLYKPHEKKEEDDTMASEGNTWLADESALAHFESLKIETNGTVHSEIAEDDGLKDSERDGNEVPLGKMIKRLKSRGSKRLKSQGTKARKVMKKKSLPAKAKPKAKDKAKAKDAENDVDILKMVREINLDNLGISSKFRSSNGHEKFQSKQTKLDKKHHKRKRPIASDATSVPVPKRRRSSSAHSAYRSSSKDYIRASKDDLHQMGVSPIEFTEMGAEVHSDSEDKLSTRKNEVDRSESDLLVSCLRKNTIISSKRKGKGADRGYGGEAHKVKEADNHDLKKPNVLVETDEIDTSSNLKSPTGSIKKRKRRSIAGLAKCTSKEGGNHPTDLIDCRIKVWWPMDKQFYEGLVQSYDPRKKKHVVLYDDGDVEVLHLEKERWELVGSSPKSSKKLHSSKSPQSVGVSPEETHRDTDGSRKNKKSSKISSSSRVKGKRTPKKNMKHGQNAVSERNFCEAESRGSSDVSDPEPTKVDDMNSGEYDGEHVEKVEESLVDKESFDNMVKSVSDGKQVADTEKSPNYTEESDKEEKPDTEGRQVEETDSIPQDTQESDEQEKSHSEEREAEESSGVSREDASKEEKLDSEGNQESDDPESNPTILEKSRKDASDSSDTGDAENSDDEPLGTWKRRVVGKSRQQG
ncbi:hypothetical protein L1049_009819 [Liquidambar formosana]|uniref:Uncharacterized protein n=1 Tax=Liquidambar formosana TaxID=63359 RepID=A0AAP0NA97_LIQFO